MTAPPNAMLHRFHEVIEMVVVPTLNVTPRHAKLQSNHQHTNTQFICTGRMPFLSLNQENQSAEVVLWKA